MKKILLFLLVVVLGTQTGIAQVVNTEGFESGIFPPPGWSAVGSVSYWGTVGNLSTHYPVTGGVTVSPHSGSYQGFYNSWTAPAGDDQTFCSPVYSRALLSGPATDSVSFWMYRDDDAVYTNADEIEIYINTTNSLSGATSLGTVARSTSLAIPNTVPSAGWYYYAFPVPAGFTGASNYILIEGISDFGTNMFIDDISWTSYPPACTGTPVAGTIAGSSAVCAPAGVGLSLIGDSISAGLAYQWYSSPAGAGTFTAIAGATNSTYDSSGFSATTDYYAVVTCTSSSQSDTTPVYTVTLTPFYLCYCSPAYGETLNTYPGPSIDSFAIAGTTLNNNTPGGAAAYTQYWPATPSTTASMSQGSTYTAFINANDGADNYNADLWIDYNHTGGFGDTVDEYIPIASDAAYNIISSATFIIPANADTGLTGLRIRVSDQYDAMGTGDACTEIYDGTTEDYVIDITPGITCSGMPSAGTGIPSSSTVCAAGSFNLTDTGYTNGLGLTYQWYSSPSGAGTYSVVYAGTGPTVTGQTQTSATDYIFVVTCDSSGLSDTSNVVTVGMSPFYLCYCSPQNGGTTLNYYTEPPIDSFAIAGTTLNNYTPGGAPIYIQYWPVTPTTTASLSQGSIYTAYINANDGFDSYNADIWIDYNHSGYFGDTANEYIQLASDASNNATSLITFTVNATADTGLTGLRVRVSDQYDAMGSGDACTEEFGGATQDYVIYIAEGVYCNGVPVAGVAAGPGSICASGSFNLSDTGYSNAIGISYQWYASPSGAGTYTGVYGGGGPTVSNVTQTYATDYIFVATCDSGGFSDTSNVVTVGMSPFYLCYCSPQNGGTTLNYYTEPPIDSFAIAGTTLNNYTPGGAPIYIQYWPVTPTTTASLSQGSIYTAYINANDGFDSYNADIWIDYNHSGYFGDTANEYIQLASDASNNATSLITFTVNATADTGLTGLRVRVSDQYDAMGSGDACTEEFGGATQDYVIYIAQGIPCSGLPVAGNAIGVASVCGTGTFNLNDTGFSNGLGLSYQWYASPSGAGTYTGVYGGGGPTVSNVTQTYATDYVFVVTCDSSGLSDTSNVVTVGMTPFYLCYCSPQSGGTTLDQYANPPIDSFAIAGTSLNNYTPGGAPIYIQYWPTTTTTTTSLLQGDVYTAYVSANDGSDNYNADIWIDYNHSGYFGDTALEYIFVSSDVPNDFTSSASFMVPGTADTGLTGLRVRVSYEYDPMGSGDACTEEYNGATQDYVIEIAPGVPCTGTPVSGTATSSNTSVCAAGTFNLNDTGYSTGLGLTYQWYFSPAGLGTYSVLYGGASTSVLGVTQTSATDYIFVATCDSSGLSDTSNVITVGMNPFYLCYCGPTTSYTITSYDDPPIDSVAISGTTLDNHEPYSALAYTQFWPVTPNTTGTLQQAAFYTVSVNSNEIFEDYNAAAWIDYGHTGVFSSSDNILASSSVPYGVGTSATFLVPATADTGLTGFRVYVTPSYETLGASDACSFNYDGVVQDYVITIAPGVSCAGIPTGGVAVSSADSTCDAIAVTLSDTAGETSIGYTFQWQSSTDSIAWSNIAGATSDPYTTATGITANTYYRLVITCTVSGLSDTSSPVIVYHNSCVCIPSYEDSYGGDLDGAMTEYQITGYGGTSIEDNIGTTSDTVNVGYVDHTYDTVTLQQGGTYGDTITYANSAGYTANQIFIDYNDDGYFDTVTEVVSNLFPNSSGYTDTVYGTTTIAPTATIGLHRMRVRNIWYVYSIFSALGSGGSTTLNPCGPGDASGNEYWSGVTADYMVNIVPTYCDSVTGITITGVTSSTATVTWNSISGTSGYEYTIDTSSAVPAGSGTATTDTTVNFTGLIPGSTYYVYVRNSCGGGSFSVWQEASFTAFCDTISGLTVTGITDTSATISWTAVAGTIDYQYVINTSSAAPAGSGTVTSGTTVTDVSLIPGTLYYAHVRNQCAGGYSSWITVPFTTAICDSVTGLTVTGSDTGLVLSFTASSGSLGYYYFISTTPGAPAGGGTFTTNTTDTVTGLTPGTVYYVYVRSSCSLGYSTWDSVTTATDACDTVTGLSVYANDTFAYVTWTASPGVTGYEYVISTTPGSPTGSGTFTTATADSILSGLLPDTTYYASVRVSCGGGDYSAWVTVPFTLAACDTTVAFVADTTSTTATIDWIFQAGAGYYFVLNTNPSAPTSTAGATYSPAPDTSFSYSALLPDSTYYFHIEVLCNSGTGESSSWITISFTTPNNVSVVNVNNTDFGIQAFPNPATNVVTVKVTGTKGNSRLVQLTDVTGNVIEQVNMVTDQVGIDVSNIAAGIYLIKYTDDDHSQVIKINKQ